MIRKGRLGYTRRLRADRYRNIWEDTEGTRIYNTVG